MSHSRKEGWCFEVTRKVMLPNVEDLRNRILEEAHGSCYSIHHGSTNMNNELREVFGRIS